MLIIHHANEVWEDGQAEHVPSYSKVKLSTELTILNKKCSIISNLSISQIYIEHVMETYMGCF